MDDGGQQFSLVGKKILVTGGSEGIGRDMAVAFARMGADVAVTARREAKLQETIALIAQAGRKGVSIPCDLQHLPQVERMVARVYLEMGRLDVLVNNAGAAVTKPAIEMTEPEWDLQTSVAFRSLFFCSQYVARRMAAHGGGKIINIGSTTSKSVIEGRSVYGAVKAGVTHLTESLAVEWARYGILVNTLSPAATVTPSRVAIMLERPEVRTELLRRIPLGRLAVTHDLMGAAIFFASSASDFITGQTLFVDGAGQRPDSHSVLSQAWLSR
ncbi:MAG: SDR family oxidoreductase [Proteobacteria bacterium]|nr:SDR family oxidoreductase [Pseudomonadota bacterium]